MSDLIDRQEAIDAILAVTGNSSVRELYEHVQEHGLSDMWTGGVNAAIDIIIAVPSVQLGRKSRLVAEIEGKTPEETYDFLSWLMVDYGLRFTDTRQAVIEWLRGEQDG